MEFSIVSTVREDTGCPVVKSKINKNKCLNKNAKQQQQPQKLSVAVERVELLEGNNITCCCLQHIRHNLGVSVKKLFPLPVKED